MQNDSQKATHFSEILAGLKAELRNLPFRDDRARLAMRRIHERLSAYDWIGVYWLRADGLELGPYFGAPTEHTHIPVGVGVCGTAVATGENQLIGDVRELSNYLACSLETRSEIVVLLRDDEGRVLGQIDADGHSVAAFDQEDEAFLTAVGRLILSHFE